MNDETPARGAEDGGVDADFSAFSLDLRLLGAVGELGFETPTPIQAAAIGPLLENRDVIGSARTGSGKTAAFGLPLLHRVADGEDGVRAIILTPTRELCGQVAKALESFAAGMPQVRLATIYGGAAYGPQVQALRGGARVVVGTPGRVIDHLERGTLVLDKVEVFVLDEADEMLQMGFLDDVQAILEKAPDDRQIALFSATMPDAIVALAERFLREPVTVQPESSRMTVDHVEQRALLVPSHHKVDALYRVLCATRRDATLVFARTRAACAEVADELTRRGMAVDALHGDLPQAARERVVARLRSRRIDVVIATDVAARGLDIDHVSHVINLDLPINAEIYVHRIGRTARAGRDGEAISFVTRGQLARIEGFARRLKADIAPMDVPSDAAIAAHERGMLLESVARADGDEANEDDADALLATLQAQTGWDDKQAAMALLRQLAKRDNVRLDAVPDDEPPPWARPKTKKQRRTDIAGPGTAELLVHAGRRDGARAADVLASLARGLEVPAEAIGRITILATKIFVRMPEEVVAQLAEQHKTMVIRGADVPIELATPRGDRRGPPRRRERNDSKGPKQRWSRERKRQRNDAVGKRESRESAEDPGVQTEKPPQREDAPRAPRPESTRPRDRKGEGANGERAPRRRPPREAPAPNEVRQASDQQERKPREEKKVNPGRKGKRARLAAKAGIEDAEAGGKARLGKPRREKKPGKRPKVKPDRKGKGDRPARVGAADRPPRAVRVKREPRAKGKPAAE